MTRRLSDLTDHLFTQMDRLGKADTAEAVATEARRAKAMVKVADQILGTARVQLEAAKIYVQSPAALPLLPQIGEADPETARLTAQPPRPRP